MTRTEAEIKLRSAGLSQVAIRETIRVATEAASTAQHQAQQGHGEYGARDERAYREFDRVFETQINHELTQPR